MTPEDIDPLLNSVGLTIEQQAAAAYERFREMLAQGIAPQVAIRRVAATFDPALYLALSGAFEQILGQRWPVAAMKNYRVGQLTLSKALYRQWDITGRAVTAMVNNHAKGVQQAKELALELYTGYGLNQGEPLSWARDRVALLPKPLRQLVASPGVRNVLEDAARRSSVSRLRTKALKAAYAQLVETELLTASGPAFDNALRVALEEKMRYFANRIAQTELARAHAIQAGQELLEDDTVEVVQWRLSGAHPRADICDLFATVNRWGLGPGCYPKGKAPRPIAHPFCRCRLRSRPDLTAAGAVEDTESERKVLGRYSERDAARLMGSRRKLAAVQGGQEARDVWNEGKPPEYRLPLLGEASPTITPPVPTPPTPPPPVTPVTKPRRTSTRAPALPAAPSYSPPVLGLAPQTTADFVAAGRGITDTLGAAASVNGGIANAEAVIAELVRRLEASGLVGQEVAVATGGPGAALVKRASKLYPKTWLSKVDATGPLHVRQGTSRGWAYTVDKDAARYSSVRLSGWGRVPAVEGHGYIMVPKGDFGVAIHEFAHRIQSCLPELDKLFQDLHRRRTAGAPLRRLKDIQPGTAYGPREVAREDSYTNPYQGKEYGQGQALEVITMAFEAVLGLHGGANSSHGRARSRFVDMWMKDREMLDLVVGTLFYWRPVP